MPTENEIVDSLIQSPCVKNCCLNEDDVCLGCFRSIAEIVAWGNASNQQKKTCLEESKRRKQAHIEKYGSRFI